MVMQHIITKIKQEFVPILGTYCQEKRHKETVVHYTPHAERNNTLQVNKLSLCWPKMRQVWVFFLTPDMNYRPGDV